LTEWLKTTLQRLVLCILTLGLLLTTTASTWAGDVEIVSYEQILSKETSTFAFPPADRCTGEPRTIKLTSDGSFRITMVTSGPDAGFYWISPRQKGTFEIVSTGPNEPDYRGRFELLPDQHTVRNGEVTYFLHLVGWGTDGSGLDTRLLERLSVSKDQVTISMASPTFLSYQTDCA
jgi:hypothetical protein